MKYIICIVLIATCLELVCSLQCYVCLTPTPSDLCLVKKNCSRYHSWCSTTVYGPSNYGFPFTGYRDVVRDCAEKCKATNPNSLGVIRPVICCQKDLCNTANTTSYGIMETHANYYTLTAAIYSVFTALQVIS